MDERISDFFQPDSLKILVTVFLLTCFVVTSNVLIHYDLSKESAVRLRTDTALIYHSLGEEMPAFLGEQLDRAISDLSRLTEEVKTVRFLIAPVSAYGKTEFYQQLFNVTPLSSLIQILNFPYWYLIACFVSWAVRTSGQRLADRLKIFRLL